MPWGADSDPPVIQLFVLILSYVNGWIAMFREYGRGRRPGPIRGGWNTTYGKIPRTPSGSSSPVSISATSATKSLQPSPICSWPVRQLTPGPPVSRFDSPCPYSCRTVAVSWSPTLIGGRAVLRCTEPGVGDPAIAALIALPSARPIRIAGIPTGDTIDPDINAGVF